MNKKKIIYLVCILLSIPSICFADAVVPLLLVVNGFMFIVGQVWILLSEFLYLKYIMHLSASKKTILKITFFMNLRSTIIGAILFPLLLAIITFPGFYYRINWGDVIASIGTWTPFKHSDAFTIFWVFITFLITIWVEYKYINKVLLLKGIEYKGNLLKHSIIFNMISYLGLILGLIVLAYLSTRRIF